MMKNLSRSPKPVIEWRINGFPVKEFGASVNPNTGDLVISSAKGEIHSGFYQCFATNKAGQIVSKSFAQVGDSILSNSDDYDAFDEVESVRDFQVSPIYTFFLTYSKLSLSCQTFHTYIFHFDWVYHILLLKKARY